jgi:CRP-like cAMP-binding protein
VAKSRPSGGYDNLILSRLSPKSLASVRRHLRPVELEIRQVIYRPHHPIEHAYFPEVGMISVISIMEDGRSIEVGTIGSEGAVGGCLLLGVESVRYEYFVQLAGRANRIDAEMLRVEADKDGDFRAMILRSQAALQTQSMQTAACNGLHSIQQRCCRWLLSSHDRAKSMSVDLTHEFLAIMLGVRRASVSEVLRPLQDRGWIESTRGKIKIVDRKGLESGSCECYRVIADATNGR